MYFGANNYQAGLLGGRYLGKYAQRAGTGQVDEVLILELARAGALVGARSKGIVAGVKEALHLGDAFRGASSTATGSSRRRSTKCAAIVRMSKARQVLVGAANDPSALGAVRAFQETGREATCAVVGQNAEPDARQELRSARTPLVASVAVFSGAVRRGSCPSRARHPVEEGRAAGRLHAASDHHRRKRRPLLSQRFAGRGRQRHCDWRETALRFAKRNNVVRAEIPGTPQISSQFRPRVLPQIKTAVAGREGL